MSGAFGQGGQSGFFQPLGDRGIGTFYWWLSQISRGFQVFDLRWLLSPGVQGVGELNSHDVCAKVVVNPVPSVEDARRSGGHLEFEAFPPAVLRVLSNDTCGAPGKACTRKSRSPE